MTRLDISYQGFKLGNRIGDQIALQLDVTNPHHVAILHKLKNMVYIEEQMRLLGVIFINNKAYAK